MITFINIYEAKIRVRDDAAREHVFIQIFYAFSKVFQNVIVKLFWMIKTNSHIDWTTLIWCFEINFKKIRIQFFKDFLDLNDKMFVYVLIYITFDVEITLEMRRLFELLKNYENCFDFKNTKIFFEHENKNHVINLIFDAESSYESFYILSEIELDVLRNYLLKNLILNRIQEFTNRASALMLFVFKKNHSLRLCVDYKELNALIIKNKCSFLLIDEMLDRFMSAAYFIKLDFKNAYYRIKIRKSDEWMTAFCIPYDHFEYAIMFFELANASVTFQTLINKILRELINYICVIYLNDILIFFKTREKHWKCVHKMLERLRQFKLYAKLLKCFFMTQMIKFLEYIINNHDVFMNSRRIKSYRHDLNLNFYTNCKYFENLRIFINVLWDFILKSLMLWQNCLKKINKENKMNHSFLKRSRDRRFNNSLKHLRKRLCWFILTSEFH